MKLFELILLVFLSLQSQAQNGWYQRAIFPGTPRALSASFVIGDDIYLCGGTNYDTMPVSNLYLNDCWRYNTLLDQWFQIDSIPVNANSLNKFAFTINGKGYVCLSNSELWEYDPSTTLWSQKSSAPFQVVCNECAYFSKGDTGYYFPSYNPNLVFKYNAYNDIWLLDTIIPNFFFDNCWGLGKVIKNDDLFFLGGFVGSLSNCTWINFLGSYNIYNEATSYFGNSSLQNLDSCYGFNYLFLFDSTLYFGNSTPETNTTTGYPPYWNANPHSYSFNLATSNLDTLPDFPYGPSTASNYFTIGNCGYLMCGVGGMNGNRTLLFCPDSINAINEIENAKLNIYPNPFNESFKINSKNTIENYKIIDVLGNEILNGNPNGKSFEVKTDKIKAGIYLIECYSHENKKFTHQTIIKL